LDRATQVTWYPLFANSRAKTSPMPLLAPVTIAVLFFMVSASDFRFHKSSGKFENRSVKGEITEAANNITSNF
jgi:hypothetical protein